MTDAALLRPHLRAARVVNEVLSPVVVIPTLLLVVGAVAASSPLRGAALGLIAAFFAVALPYGVLLAQLRRGRLGDRHLSDRRERPAVLAVAAASVTAGLWLVDRLNAPAELVSLVVAMAAGVVVSLMISAVWKISIHTACMAGSVVSLAILVHPVLIFLAPLAGLTGWGRVSVRAHTVPQVLLGGVVGACVAGGVLLVVLR